MPATATTMVKAVWHNYFFGNSVAAQLAKAAEAAQGAEAVAGVGVRVGVGVGVGICMDLCMGVVSSCQRTYGLLKRVCVCVYEGEGGELDDLCVHILCERVSRHRPYFASFSSTMTHCAQSVADTTTLARTLYERVNTWGL